jgi:hypothetical protein
MAEDSYITIEQAKELVKSKEHMYKAMQRSKFFLPHLKSSLVTQEYMQGVRSKVLWCPLYSDLKPQPCPDPPSKEFLVKEVLKYAVDKKFDTGIIDMKLPDKGWLI